MKKCWVYSNCEFNYLMREKGWIDGNTPEDSAFISICDPDYTDLDLELYHWFKQDSDNVINLDFADIGTYQLFEVKGMSDDQSGQLYEFIKRNLGKDFYIHCAAGMSRSQGVARFITDCFPDIYSKESLRKENPCLTPNFHVVNLLKRRWREDENQTS